MTVDLSDGVHGGFNPVIDLRYEYRTTIEGKTFFVARRQDSFWVSERGKGDPYPFWVTLPIAGRRDSVLGCTCQNLGGNRVRGLDERGMAEIIIPQGQAEICLHVGAAMHAAGCTLDALRGVVSDAVIAAEYRRRMTDKIPTGTPQ